VYAHTQIKKIKNVRKKMGKKAACKILAWHDLGTISKVLGTETISFKTNASSSLSASTIHLYNLLSKSPLSLPHPSPPSPQNGPILAFSPQYSSRTSYNVNKNKMVRVKYTVT
jgi:hypothetical protein